MKVFSEKKKLPFLLLCAVEASLDSFFFSVDFFIYFHELNEGAFSHFYGPMPILLKKKKPGKKSSLLSLIVVGTCLKLM